MIGIFVDVSDIYHKVNRRFGTKLNYQKYISVIGDNIYRAYAYGAQRNKEASSFMACLRHCGFSPKFKSPKVIVVGDREIKHCDWGVGIAVDVIHTLDKIDTVVLGTSNPDFIPLVQWCRDQGKQVIIFASCIPLSLEEAANGILEINEDMLESS